MATQAERRREATRTKIVRAARELVVERGYDRVSTSDVLARTGVSRGTLYHHFESKTELFAAVVDALERDFIAQLADAVAQETNPLSALRAAAQWYLDEALGSEELQRVGLLEGRRALGWKLWRETITPHGFSVLRATLAAAMEEGQIKQIDQTALAHMLLAMLLEATAIILSSAEPEVEREKIGVALAALIDGLAGT